MYHSFGYVLNSDEKFKEILSLKNKRMICIVEDYKGKSKCCTETRGKIMYLRLYVFN